MIDEDPTSKPVPGPNTGQDSGQDSGPVAGAPSAKQERLLRLSESNRILEVFRVLSIWVALALGIGIITGDAAHLRKYWDKLSLALPEWSDEMLQVEVPSSAVQLLHEEQLLQELYPLPAPVLDLQYTISGPAGISGQLLRRIWIGGRAEEKWELEIVEDLTHSRSLEGIVIRSDRLVATRWDGSRLLIRPSMAGKLRQAFAELDGTMQRKVIDGVHHWQTIIEELRSDSDEASQKVLGYPCVEISLSAYTICMWEAARVPLRVQGSQFAFEVVSVRAMDRAGSLVHLSKDELRRLKQASKKFDSPTEKSVADNDQARRKSKKKFVDKKAPEEFAMATRFRFDAKTVLEQVADGNFSDLAVLLASEDGLFGNVLPGHDFDQEHGE